MIFQKINMGNSSAIPDFRCDYVDSKMENNDPNRQFVVYFEGCCRWFITPLEMWKGIPTRQDCPHYSSKGYTRQDWTTDDFKESMAFVTTRQALMKTLERYQHDESYSKQQCTVRYCTNFRYQTCAKGKGYSTNAN
jgi:hypothetical protein